jgi:hypothetical protein
MCHALRVRLCHDKIEQASRESPIMHQTPSSAPIWSVNQDIRQSLWFSGSTLCSKKFKTNNIASTNDSGRASD